METGVKPNRIIKIMEDLRGHALWEAIRTGLEHIFRWETLKGIVRYVGGIGGTMVVGAQWMGRFHPVLFTIGILVAGISLIRIGMVYGRKPSTEQIAEQPQPTIAATQPQQQPKTYRVTEEESKSVTEGNTTVTVTVRRIVEVSVAMLICVGVGSQFIPADREAYPHVSSTRLPSSDEVEEKLPLDEGVAATRDPDDPVWVATNSNKYVCYEGDWKRYTKTSHGKWMKESQARKQHKKPDRESCE